MILIRPELIKDKIFLKSCKDLFQKDNPKIVEPDLETPGIADNP